MIDLHTHTIFSDGVLIPSELIRRAEAIGYSAIAITDHADISNIDFIIPRIVKACADLSKRWNIIAVPGIELTHIPPETIHELAKQARQLGAKLVIVHGETIVEPVIPGTNRAALEAPIDILAHPGLLTVEEAIIAKKNHIALEISTRKGHSYTNGHVVKTALQTGANLVLNNDAHEPSDLVTQKRAEEIALGAGLPEEMLVKLFKNSEDIVNRVR